MGAKQSKRSVDISGKEAEGAGEVAAAGAGGEGRVEQLADADALKPQLNGDAHIHEPTDKEKELDSGTPENEKDATTEKENKEQDEEKDKETTPVSNGDGEQKTDNADSATSPEDGKKPKKEKVKKKWSLRSISFSRKDKPKQEKKPKEEEPKTNGEPEKVPEETTETTPETVVNEETEEVKVSGEVKDEKTPETPVTEPITNGSSTPESPKLEIPAVEETPAVLLKEDKAEITPEPIPELPINGLSLEETKQEIPEIENKIEEIIASKPEETPVETTEVVPVPEIPVKTEVCVEQVPLIEPTPPPLPANPPPSSVASFAATTMAPELTDASLSNTAETAVPPPPTAMDSKTLLSDNHSEPQTNLTNVTTATDVLTLPPKETVEDNKPDDHDQPKPKIILETSPDTLTVNIDENKKGVTEIETVLKEIAKISAETTVVDKLEDVYDETVPKEAGEAISEETEKKVDSVIESIEVKEPIQENIVEVSETKEEIKTGINHTNSESKELGQDVTEVLPEPVEIEPKDIEFSSDPLDIKLPMVEITDFNNGEVASPELNVSNVVSDVKEEHPISPQTNTTIEPPVVDEIVDSVELPPPPAIVPDKVDVQNDAMDEGNDAETQEAPSKIDSDLESNMVTDDKDTEIITENTEENKAVNEDNVNDCKDSLGNIIENVECNGNIKDMAQKIVPADVAPPVEDNISLNAADNEAETPDDSIQSLSEANESMPAVGSMDSETFPLPATAEATPPVGDSEATPQDPLPEVVCDKVVELITEVSPVPELKTEMETSSDVAVAN